MGTLTFVARPFRTPWLGGPGGVGRMAVIVTVLGVVALPLV